MTLITLNELWTGLLGSLIFGFLLWDGRYHLQSWRACRIAQALAQQALAEIDAYYANAPFGLCRLDTDLRCVRLNAALAAMNRRPVEAHLGQHLCEVLPDLADELEAAARQTLRTGQPFHDLELSGNTAFPSGQRRRWRVSGYPLTEASGQVIGLHLVIQEVTAPRYAEAQMTQLLQVVENSAEFIGLTRLDQRAWYLNQAGRQLVGLADEAAVWTTRIEDYLFPEDRAFAQETVLSKVQRDGRWAGEFRFRHFQTGEPIPVWWQVFRLDDPKTGQPTSLATVTRDLRATKAAEHTLRQYQQIVAAIPDSVSLVDRQYRYQIVNAEYLRRTGKPEATIVGHPVAEVLGEAVFQNLIQPHLERGLRGQTVHYQAWFEFAITGRQFIDVIYSPYRDEQNELAGVVVTARDITPLKQAEEAVRTSEARLRLALQAAQAGVWEWNWTTSAIVWSPENYALYGRDPALGPPTYDEWETLLQAEDREATRQARRTVIEQSRQEYRAEFRVRHPQRGVRWLLALGRVDNTSAETPPRLMGINLDITERKQLEAALQEADRRKDEFLAMLAHELRNPLAPIRNAVQILKRLGPAEPKLQWARDVIERQVKHLARLVDDLLDSARLVRGQITLKKEPVELATIVQQAVEAAQPLLEAHQHQFHLTLPHSPVWLEGDSVRLVQVLLNLLDNAAKYTEPGGRIELQAEALGAEVAVQVRDTGPGLSPALLSRAFELFEQGERTLDRAQGGLGIGLALVRRLIELHGGRVEAHSAGLGQGAEFTVWLPTRATGAPTAETVIPSMTARPAPNPRVLLVDDDPDVVESLALWLQLEGFEVRAATTGQAALDLARQFHPQIVLLDLGMPGMNGYEVARRLRERPPDECPTRLIALTGYGDEGTRQCVQEAGFTHHLVKPVEPEVLLTLLRTDA